MEHNRNILCAFSVCRKLSRVNYSYIRLERLPCYRNTYSSALLLKIDSLYYYLQMTVNIVCWKQPGNIYPILSTIGLLCLAMKQLTKTIRDGRLSILEYCIYLVIF